MNSNPEGFTVHMNSDMNSKMNNDRCEEAFQELKMRLTSAPILIVPDRGQGYTVYCDASRA